MKKAYPPLTADRFDAITKGTEHIWGLTGIAHALGISEATARRYAARPNVPIYKPEGTKKYYATRTELNHWLRNRT
ncbi:DNA-binding protein [Shimia sediminis]|uniref:DNA-binding protein n=1 Tax=Shimia sediminis TaxID=2497945 RepID=UPI000F8D3516|nr:DNA-binding protein [Shimia sediminis]